MKTFEFVNIFFSLFGIVALLLWIVEYWNIFKKGQLVVSRGSPGSRLLLRRILIFIIGVAGWACITFSVTGPRKPLGFVQDEIEINDITFVVDVSRSMLATDFTPNRLEVAKSKILDFIKLRPRDRIGIIIFSEKVFTLLPLTTDLELIDKIVPQIKPGFLGSGTNIGDAIGLAVGRGLQSIAKSKIVILLTDGVSNVGMITPVEAANKAKENNIKVYTIGIGGKGDAKIPVPRHMTGGRLIYQTIPGGSVDFAVLKTISKISNGKNYVARDETALGNVLKDIELLERTKVNITGHVVYKEYYLIFIIVGAVLLLLAEMSRRMFTKEAI